MDTPCSPQCHSNRTHASALAQWPSILASLGKFMGPSTAESSLYHETRLSVLHTVTQAQPQPPSSCATLCRVLPEWMPGFLWKLHPGQVSTPAHVLHLESDVQEHLGPGQASADLEGDAWVQGLSGNEGQVKGSVDRPISRATLCCLPSPAPAHYAFQSH